jgi:N12 class adenine-specific DNA methylase
MGSILDDLLQRVLGPGPDGPPINDLATALAQFRPQQSSPAPAGLDWSSDVGAGAMRNLPPVEEQYAPGHDRWAFWNEEGQRAQEAMQQGDWLTALQHGIGRVPGLIGAPLTMSNELIARRVLGAYVTGVAKGPQPHNSLLTSINPLIRFTGLDPEEIYKNRDQIAAAYDTAPYGQAQRAWEMASRGMAPVQAGLAEMVTDPTNLIGFGTGETAARGLEGAATSAAKSKAGQDMLAAMMREAGRSDVLPRLKSAGYGLGETAARAGQISTLPVQFIDRLADRIGPYAFGGMLGAMATGAGLSRLDPETAAKYGIDPSVALAGGATAGALGIKGLGRLPIFALSRDAKAQIEAGKVKDALNNLRRTFGTSDNPIADFGQLSGAGGTPPIQAAEKVAPAAAPADLGALSRMTKGEVTSMPGTNASIVWVDRKPVLQVYDKAAYGRGEKPTYVKLDKDTEALVNATNSLPPRDRAAARQDIAGQVIDKLGKRGEWTEHPDLHREAVATADYKGMIANGDLTAQRAVDIYKSAGMRAPDDIYKMAAQEKKLSAQAQRDTARAFKEQSKTEVTQAAEQAKKTRDDAAALAKAEAAKYPEGMGQARMFSLGPGEPVVKVLMHPQDEAAFLATRTRSGSEAAKAAYAERFMEKTGATPEQVTQHGQAIRDAIKRAAKNAKPGEPIELPQVALGTLPTKAVKERMATAVVAQGPESMATHAINTVIGDSADAVRSLVQNGKLDSEIAPHFQRLYEEATAKMKPMVRNSMDRAANVIGQAPPAIQRDIARDYWAAVRDHLKANREHMATVAEAQRHGADTGPLWDAYQQKVAQIWDERSAKEATHYARWRGEGAATPQEQQAGDVHPPSKNGSANGSQAHQDQDLPANTHNEVQVGKNGSNGVRNGATSVVERPTAHEPSPELVVEADKRFFSQFKDRDTVVEDVLSAATKGEHGDWSELWALYRQAHADEPAARAARMYPGESLDDFASRLGKQADQAAWFSIKNGISKATDGKYHPATPKYLVAVFEDKTALRQYVDYLANRAEEHKVAPWSKGSGITTSSQQEEGKTEGSTAVETPSQEGTQESPASGERLAVPHDAGGNGQEEGHVAGVHDANRPEGAVAEEAAAKEATTREAFAAIGRQIVDEYKNAERYTPFESLTERQLRGLEAAGLTDEAKRLSNERAATGNSGPTEQLQRPVDQQAEHPQEGNKAGAAEQQVTQSVESPMTVGTEAATTTTKEAGSGRAGVGTENSGSLAGELPGSVQGAGAERGANQRGRENGAPNDQVREPASGAGVQSAGGRERSNEGSGPGNHSVSTPVDTTRGHDHVIDLEADPVGAKAGAATVYGENLSAIKLLKQLQAEGRKATSEEQAILSKYRGWGASKLNSYFDPYYRDKGAEIKALLGEDEYRALQKSRLNAHYTSPEAIGAIWTALDRMGLGRLGHIRMLEPSAGSGWWLGLQPAHLTARSARTAVELDTITGGILEQLYQNADVHVKGYQDVRLRPNDYDLIVSNVPFAKTGFNRVSWMEKGKDWLNRQPLHNQFFALASEQVRPGGVVAFITSRYTMDGTTGAKELRQWLSREMDFLGAVRLPRNAFKAVADTEVVTDLVLLRKRLPGVEPAHAGNWIDTYKVDLGSRWERGKGETKITADVNTYYREHPEMVLGEQSAHGTMYHEDDYTVTFTGDFAKALDEALAKLPEDAIQPYRPETAPAESRLHIPRDHTTLKDGSFYVEDGKAYQYIGGVGQPKEKDAARVEAFLKVRDAARQVLRDQVGGADDAALKASQKTLQDAHTAFAHKFGALNSQYNRSLFRKDPESHFMRALEKWGKNEQAAAKAGTLRASDIQMPIFRERVVREVKPVLKADRAEDALAVVLNERGHIDFDHMARLTGRSVEDLQRDLKGVVFHNPDGDWETAEEYLSGYVKDKLASAREWAKKDGRYAENADALEKVQPADVPPSQIEVRLGSHWLPAETIQQFAEDTFQLGKGKVQLAYHSPIAEWSFETNPNWWGVDRALNFNQYGTDRVAATDIFQAVMNSKPIKVYDTVRENGTDKSVLNTKATAAAREKAELLQEAFRKWIWQDTGRADKLSRLYNDRFNNYLPRTFDGKHLSFPGMATDWADKLKEHQRGAVWRVLSTGNTLLAHEVGAGKTAEMVAAGMEMRRMGLSKKNLYVVPNHLVQQWADDFLSIYPDARLLVPTKADFRAASRAELMSRIATGDHDAVIIAQSQMTLLPVRPETMAAHINKELDELRGYLEELRHQSKSKDTRQSQKDVQRVIDSLEKKLDKQQKKLGKRQDSTVYFEDLGVDGLFVDEADMYKNLFFTTRMERIKGLSNTDSERAMDMFLKVQQTSARNGGRGVTFATGTPVSNTIAELWTMMRYLMPDKLESLGLGHFDSWASQFAEPQTTMAQTVSGKIEPVTRFSKFVNVPELSKLFQHVADIQTAEDLNLPRPKIVGGKPEVVASKPSAALLDYMGRIIKRIENLGNMDPRVDNMLKISSDARKAALDMRLVDPHAPEDPQGKIPNVASKVVEVYKKYTDTGNPKTDRAAQLVFLDLGTPKVEDSAATATAKAVKVAPDDVASEYGDELTDAASSAREALTGEEGKLLKDVYSLLKAKMVAGGIPEDRIAFIHEFDSAAAKKKLFDAVNDGEIRVLIGSTGKMGPGMNVQERLVALHHVDAPWRPRDIGQRDGRILRQGNNFGEVHILQYVTEKSFDGYIWETLYNKAKAIKSIVRRNVVDRSVVDNDDMVLSAAEAKAIASGDPMIFRKAELEAKVAKLRVRQSTWQDEQHTARQAVARLPQEIETYKRDIADHQANIELRDKTSGAKFAITLEAPSLGVAKTTFTDKKAFADALAGMTYPKTGKWIDEYPLGQYRGFKMNLKVWSDGTSVIDLKSPNGWGYPTSTIGKGELGAGTATRLDNALERMESEVQYREQKIAKAEKELGIYQGQIGKPFAEKGELATTEQELVNTLSALGVGKDDGSGQALGVVHPSVQRWGEVFDMVGAMMRGEKTAPKAQVSEDLRVGLHDSFPTMADEDANTLVTHWDAISKTHKAITKDKQSLTDELERLAGQGYIESDRIGTMTLDEALKKLKGLSQDPAAKVNWKNWKPLREKYAGTGDLLLDDPMALTSELVAGPIKSAMGAGKGWSLPHQWATRPAIGALLGYMLNPDDPAQGAMYLGIYGATTHPKFTTAFKNLALSTGRYPVANALDALFRNSVHGVRTTTKLDTIQAKIGPAPSEVSRMRMTGVKEGEGMTKLEAEKGFGSNIPIGYRMGASAAIGYAMPNDEENRGRSAVGGAAVGAMLPRWNALTRKVAAVTESTARTSAWAKGKGDYLKEEYPAFRSRLLKSVPDSKQKTKVAAVLDGEEGQFTSSWLHKTLRDLGIDQPIADKAAKDWANVARTGDDIGVTFAGHIQFDYKYTKADEFLKAFVPFHFYATRNLPWYAEHMAQHPIIANAIIQINNASENERQDMGLTGRFLGMFVLKGGLGDIASEFVGGRKGGLGIDPLAATISVVQQTRDPADWAGENTLSKAMNYAQQVGISPYPAYQAIAQASGITGSKPGPSAIPMANYLRNLPGGAGIDLEKPLRELGAKVQGKATGAEIEPEALNKSKIRTRIAEMATEAGTPGAYDAEMDNPNGAIWTQAAKDVARENEGTSALSFAVPTRAKFVSNTEQQVRETRKEHYPQTDPTTDTLDTEAYGKAAEAYPIGTTYSKAYQSPAKRAISTKGTEFENLGTPEEMVTYRRLSTAYAGAQSATSKMIFDRTVSKADQATYEKISNARADFLADPANADFAGYWKRNAEEAKKGNAAYGQDDYLKETGHAASTLDLQTKPTAQQAATEQVNQKTGNMKYQLQNDLGEYMDFKDKNWMLMGTSGGSKWRTSFLATRPLLASYFAWRSSKGYPDTEPDNMGHVDAFLKERLSQ